MTLPSEINVQTENQTTRIILPTRQRTVPRWIGLVPIVFGLVFVLVGAGIMLNGWRGFNHPEPQPVQFEPDELDPEAPNPEPPHPEMPDPIPAAAPQGHDWSELLGGCFGIPFFLIGLIPVAFGVLSFFPSHAEVILTPEQVIAISTLGPLPIRQKRPLSSIKRLRVGILFTRKNEMSGTDPNNHCIYADDLTDSGETTGPSLRLAQQYRPELLIPLAEFLVEEIKRRGSVASLQPGVDAAPQVITTVDPEPAPSESEPIPQETVPDQPANSKIIFVPAADALTFMIPRTGFRGSALFFLLIALFWNSISYTLFAAMLLEFLRDISLETLGVLAFLSLFVAIGTIMFLVSIQLAFRKSVLLATHDSLVLTQTGPLRNSEFQWRKDEIQAIRCGNSNTTVNRKPLQELQIQSSKQSLRRGLLEGRDETELQWLAATLRAFYRVRP